jgi:hypothetical protein
MPTEQEEPDLRKLVEVVGEVYFSVVQEGAMLHRAYDDGSVEVVGAEGEMIVVLPYCVMGRVVQTAEERAEALCEILNRVGR